MTLDTFLPFCRPTLDEASIDEVVDSLRSGWITTGPKVAKFEDMLRTYFDAPHALALGSATAGLYLALQALQFNPGDEVITTPMTFAGTLNVIVLNGLRPVLVDVDPVTYNMDVSQIESCITPKTRAIMPVHFAGLSVDLDPLYHLAAKYGLRVIEDAAHAMGTTYKGKKIGSFGDIHVFSFHPNKNMTTGEGGCVITRDADLAKRISLLRFHGMDREAWNRFGKTGTQDYEIVIPGHKFNMMDIQGALGIHQLPQLETFNSKRKHLAHRYLKELAGIKSLQLPSPGTQNDGHAWHLFAPLAADRTSLMAELKERNIGTGLHYKSVHLYPYYRETFGWRRGDFPQAEKVGDSILSLPLFPLLTEGQQDEVISTLHKILD